VAARPRPHHHTKAFRRLKHKTQVFVSPEHDHYRTRLTHTLEVTQIARTVARALRLNEDLTEAIGMGHDLGHAPFGHVGEEALDEAYRRFDAGARFRHYEQSLRIVDELEKNGSGLNLTWEVRDGILHHSKARATCWWGNRWTSGWRAASPPRSKARLSASATAWPT
jgi:dGTPase